MGATNNESNQSAFESPEARSLALKAKLAALVEEGFSPKEIQEAAAAMEASTHAPHESAEAPLSPEITAVAASLKAHLPSTSPEAFPSCPTPAESAEAPLEADPFSKEAILRINAIYQIADPQELAEFLDDDEYPVYHQRLVGTGKYLHPERVPIAQQFICTLPQIPEGKRSAYVVAYMLNTLGDGRPWSPEIYKTLNNPNAPHDKKRALLLHGLMDGAETREEPNFDYLQKLGVLSSGNTRSLPSYALLRLFRRGELRQFSLGEQPISDDFFFRYATITGDGFLDIAEMKEGKLFLSVDRSVPGHHFYINQELPSELSTLVLAECKAICLEMLPSMNYLMGKGGDYKSTAPIYKLLEAVDLSGLRQNLDQSIVSTAKGSAATPVSRGATALGKIWHQKGKEDQKAEDKKGIDDFMQKQLAHRVFGGNKQGVTFKYAELERRIDLLMPLLALEGQEDKLTALERATGLCRPAIIPALTVLSREIKQNVEALVKLPDDAAWRKMKTEIETNSEYLSLITLLARIKKLGTMIKDPNKIGWPTNFGFKTKAPLEKELSEKMSELPELQSKFANWVTTNSQVGKFLPPGVPVESLTDYTVEGDVLTIGSDLVNNLKAKLKSTNDPLMKSAQAMLTHHKRLSAELAEAEAKGIIVDKGQKELLTLPENIDDILG